MIGCERDDVDPFSRFNDMKVMLHPGPGRDGRIGSDGKDAEESFGSRSNARPRVDHGLLLIRIFAPGLPKDRESYDNCNPLCKPPLIFCLLLGYKEGPSQFISVTMESITEKTYSSENLP
jgi:hypothetical protein